MSYLGVRRVGVTRTKGNYEGSSRSRFWIGFHVSVRRGRLLLGDERARVAGHGQREGRPQGRLLLREVRTAPLRGRPAPLVPGQPVLPDLRARPRQRRQVRDRPVRRGGMRGGRGPRLQRQRLLRDLQAAPPGAGVQQRSRLPAVLLHRLPLPGQRVRRPQVRHPHARLLDLRRHVLIGPSADPPESRPATSRAALSSLKPGRR
jgi:hypothetical protein